MNTSATLNTPLPDIDSKILRNLLRSAPAGLIIVAGIFLLAGACFRWVYYAQTLAPALGGWSVFAGIGMALGAAALRLLLMLNSGRDFKADNQVSGWVGAIFSAAALGYDLYEGWHITQFLVAANPADFWGIYGLVIFTHGGAFALEVRLIMTMYSDILERKRSEDRTLENLSIEHARKVKEAEAKMFTAIKERNDMKTETEALKAQVSEAEKRAAEAERKVILIKGEAEVMASKKVAEAESKIKTNGADNYTELQRLKAQYEGLERKMAELNKSEAQAKQSEAKILQAYEAAEARAKQAEAEQAKMSERIQRMKSEAEQARTGTSGSRAGGVLVSSSDDTRSKILKAAQRLHLKTGRVPTKREVEEICGISTRTMQKYFLDGAWQEAILNEQHV